MRMTLFRKNLMLSNRIPILCYHRVHTDGEKISVSAPDEYCGHVTLSTFKKQMGYLARAGYQTIGYDTLYSWITQGKKFRRKFFLIDFDDCRLNVYQNAFPVMREFNFKGTLALVTSVLNGEIPDIIKSLYPTFAWRHVEEFLKQGWHIASHTRNHPRLDKLWEKGGPDCVREELTRPIEDAEKRLGVKLTDFVYPEGRYNKDVEQIVRQHYRLARLWTARATAAQGSAYVDPETDIYRLPSINVSTQMNFAEFQAIFEKG